MANRYAVATGNWSNSAIWDGGTLPAAGDDVRSNGFVITLDQNITVLSIRNDALSPAVAGGNFLINVTGRTVNANIYAGAVDCLSITGFSGTVSITGNSYATGTNGSGVSLNGSGITLNFVGDAFSGFVNSGSPNITSNSGIRVIAGNFNFIGNAWCRGGGSTNGVLSIATNCTNTFTGNAYCNANIQHPTQGGLYVSGTNNVTVFDGIAENVTTAASEIRSTAVFVGDGATLSGQITAIGATIGLGSGIRGNSNLANPIIKKSINRSGLGALNNVKYSTILPTIDVILSNNTTLTLTDPAQTNPPAASNVRSGVVYSGGAFTGTLNVPPTNAVSYGVPVDNTTGTALLTAQDVFNAIATSTDPVAERLRNVSTVQITGDQLQAAFNA